MNVVEALDVLPILHQTNPKAVLVYAIARQFCTKKGILLISLASISDHLKFSKEEMKEACTLLKDTGLLKREEDRIVLPEVADFKSVSSPSELKTLAESGIPREYEVLLDQKQMYECYTTLGTQLWKVLAQVNNYFHLDYPTLTRLMYNPNFKKRLLDIRRKVEQAAEITGDRVTKLKKKKGSSKSIEELVDQLINEVHIRNGEELHKTEWKAPQLLRAFVVLYEKRYGEAYQFTTNPFSSLEMKEIKKIAVALNEDALVTLEYFKWCFDVKSYQPNITNPLRIRFCSSDNVIRDYLRLQASGGKVPSTSPQPSGVKSAPLPKDFLDWLEQTHPQIQEVYHFSKIDDLTWLKQAHTNKQLPDDNLIPIIEHAIQLGIV
jgi:DNA-binding Lrp family transcriptional regulator